MNNRPSGSWPETGFEEINGDLLEADLVPVTDSGFPAIQEA
jgi:hypothetical protein